MKNKKGKIIVLIIFILSVIILGIILFLKINKKDSSVLVNLTDLTYTINDKIQSIKKYSAEDFDVFYNDYKNNKLPKLYITEFIFDGVSMYKSYDLDDFIEEGNDIEIDALTITALNINTTGDIELSGMLSGMLLINTNDIDDDINIILNNVNINTNSKKVPAIYVYNKDVNYTKHSVTITTLENTKNYIVGGKFKKVSLIGSDMLDSFATYYTSSNLSNYKEYTNYYGIYKEDEISNILFAKIEASKDDLADGDPYYFYKASGAISSDIDLYFEGKGYLEITSNKKEGIETKGNLTFSGGTGDYVIEALDDCLNTTMEGNYRNAITIDVNSMKAIVSLDADEGDAIDSNGTLIINGGTIIALAKPGSDAGLDSSNGTYINGGTIISTGDMYDQISSDSKQNFMVLSFSERVNSDELITLLDNSDSLVFSFLTDRTYSNLIYSSPSLNGTYYLYKDGNVSSDDSLLYLSGTYTKGLILGYSNTLGIGGIPDNGMDRGERPELHNNMENGEMPEPPDGMDRGERPELPNNIKNGEMSFMNDNVTLNKEFIINGISNIFGGISTYTE